MRKTDHNKTILWTELNAFDPQSPDCGAAEYIKLLGFTPQAVSLFVFGSDFVHQHDGMAEDRIFPPDIGFYLDMYFEGPKHPEQVWSKFTVRQLVKSLQAHGVKVLFSIFPSTLNSRFHREWVEDHPEVRNTLCGELKRDPAAINPLKRFADGTFYEDFLLRKVLEVISDYGFDGWHLCDGYNHPWYQLWQSDFSDDMLEQSGIVLPDKTMDVDARSLYIWQEHREEWINFYLRRNAEYLQKVVTALHRAGCMVTCHTCWGRDPVDAMYRYGIDYRMLDNMGFDALIVECIGGTGELFDHIFKTHYAVPFDNVIKATSLLTRACAVKTPLLYNDCTQDLTEGWSALRHLPMYHEKAIFEYSHLGIYTKDGFNRIYDGRQVCLADSLTASEWQWLAERWALALSGTPAGSAGGVYVWSTSACDNELKYFMHRKFIPSAAILYNLLAKGADISSIVNIDDLGTLPAGTTLFAANPGLWCGEERNKLASYTGGKVITAGIQTPPEIIPAGYADTAEPLNFAVEHGYTDLPESEYARIMSELPVPVLRVYNAGKNPDAPYYRFYGFPLADGKFRILVSNTNWKYIYGEVISNKEMQSMTPVNNFRGRPFWFEKREGEAGNLVYLRVPPLGTAVVDAVYKS